jgi:hypothetical protein
MTIFNLSQSAINWLADGERGLSSEQMFETFTGLPCVSRDFRNPPCHPHDPDDLRRCMALLKDVPEFRGIMHEMRKVSPAWSRLVDRWDELAALLEQEMADRSNKGRATKTYDLMKEILRGAQ